MECPTKEELQRALDDIQKTLGIKLPSADLLMRDSTHLGGRPPKKRHIPGTARGGPAEDYEDDESAESRAHSFDDIAEFADSLRGIEATFCDLADKAAVKIADMNKPKKRFIFFGAEVEPSLSAEATEIMERGLSAVANIKTSEISGADIKALMVYCDPAQRAELMICSAVLKKLNEAERENEGGNVEGALLLANTATGMMNDPSLPAALIELQNTREQARERRQELKAFTKANRERIKSTERMMQKQLDASERAHERQTQAQTDMHLANIDAKKTLGSSAQSAAIEKRRIEADALIQTAKIANTAAISKGRIMMIALICIIVVSVLVSYIGYSQTQQLVSIGKNLIIKLNELGEFTHLPLDTSWLSWTSSLTNSIKVVINFFMTCGNKSIEVALIVLEAFVNQMGIAPQIIGPMLGLIPLVIGLFALWILSFHNLKISAWGELSLSGAAPQILAPGAPIPSIITGARDDLTRQFNVPIPNAPGFLLPALPVLPPQEFIHQNPLLLPAPQDRRRNPLLLQNAAPQAAAPGAQQQQQQPDVEEPESPRDGQPGGSRKKRSTNNKGKRSKKNKSRRQRSKKISMKRRSLY